MTNATHTPGPWYYDGDNYVRQQSSDATLVRIDDGGHINPKFALPVKEQKANACLIAESTTLYAFAAEEARAGNIKAKTMLDLLQLGY